MPKLKNAKQEKFCRHIAAGCSQAEAARLAGYSEKYANRSAYQLMQIDAVQNRVQELRKIECKKVDVSRERVLAEFAAMAFADIADYVEIDEEITKNFKGEDVKRACVVLKKTADIPPAKRKAIASIKQGRYGIEISFYDKNRALENITRIKGYAEQNTSDDGAVTIIDDL